MSGAAIPVVEIPVITIYARHSQDCKNKSDETYRRCNCPKHVRWFRSGRLYRKAAKTRSWSQAERVRDSLRQQFESAAKGEPAPENKQFKMIDEGIKLFLKDKHIQGVSDGVYKKYIRELDRLKSFCEREGVFAVNHITGELLISFCGTWDSIYHSSTTCDRVRQRLRSFLRFCYESKWIDRIPRTPKFKVAESETLPLTKEEYTRLLKVISTTVTTDITQRRTHALFQLMRYSGLAILDATTLRRDEMIYDSAKGIYKIITSRHKNENHVYVPIPNDVAEELLAIPNDNKLYFFWSGIGTGLGIVHSFQKNYIRPCFKAAGLYDDGYMKAHRLRDTFAVDLLEKGVPLEEVSKLLGHKSIKTTEDHYAKWVKSRQDRLDSLVVAAWEKRP